ncbi:peptidoglycan-binding domain-containing protein [Microbacterium sp. P07]|uniref:peptidoglycan-binding domain-containing protein n=1 Tax=Microbacterium sp. P07 TaxID=3366952 RepID=UPI0037469F5F
MTTTDGIDGQDRRRPRPPRGAGLRRVLALVGLWAVPVIAVAVAVPLTAALDARSVETPQPATVTVGSREVDRAIAVNVVATLGPQPELRTGVDGVITGLGESGTVEPGEQVFAVDGTPVLAYRGAVLYRDLAQDDRGADVAALSDYLAGLGLLDPASGGDLFGPAIAASVRALQQRLGVAQDGVFRLGYVSYVPSGATEIVEAVVGLGDRVAAGDPVLLAAAPVESVVLTPVSSGNLASYGGVDLALRLGSSAVDISGVEVRGEEAAAITGALDEAVRTGAARVETAEGAPSTYTGGILVLRTPDTTGVVPSTAVLVDAQSQTCLIAVGNGGAQADLTALPLVTATAGSELGTVIVDDTTVGAQVVRDVSTLTGEERTCG